MNHYTVIVCTELSGVWPVVGTQEGLGMLCTIISVLFKKKKKNFWNCFNEFLARISHNFPFKGVGKREFTLLRRRKEYEELVKLGSFKGRERSDNNVSCVLK